MSDKTYVECDRCGDEMEYDKQIVNHVQYKNGVLCLKCAKIRLFDDENPILHPIFNTMDV